MKNKLYTSTSLKYDNSLFAVVATFVSAAEYGPVQPAHSVVALTANVYCAHGVRPATTNVVAFDPVLIAMLAFVVLLKKIV